MLGPGVRVQLAPPAEADPARHAGEGHGAGPRLAARTRGGLVRQEVVLQLIVGHLEISQNLFSKVSRHQDS